jgi:hypothetical protein
VALSSTDDARRDNRDNNGETVRPRHSGREEVTSPQGVVMIPGAAFYGRDS